MLALAATTSLCCTASSEEAEGNSEASAISSERRPLGPDEAVRFYRELLQESLNDYQKQYPGKLGRAWCGNVTGSGDKCNVVVDRFSDIVEKKFFDKLRKTPIVVTTHDIVTRTASGVLGVESLSGHVYMAVVDIRRSPTADAFVFDPWRDASGFYDEDPNWGAKTDDRWNYANQRPR
jgi:hypothetical protein